MLNGMAVRRCSWGGEQIMCRFGRRGAVILAGLSKGLRVSAFWKRLENFFRA